MSTLGAEKDGRGLCLRGGGLFISGLDISEMKTDLVIIKVLAYQERADIIEIKTDIKKMIADIKELRIDAGELKSGQERISARLDISIDDHEQRISKLEAEAI